MLKTESRGFQNSLVEGIVESDMFSDNYKALAACILGIEIDGKTKLPSIQQCCSAYGLYDREPKTKKENTQKFDKGLIKDKSQVFKVTNIKTNETYNCQDKDEVAYITGLERKNVANYVCCGFTFKKTWKVERLTKYDHKFLRKQIRTTNIETGEVKIHDSIGLMCKDLEINKGTVNYYLRQGIGRGYKFEYIDQAMEENKIVGVKENE